MAKTYTQGDFMAVKNKTASALDFQHKEVVKNLQNYETSIGKQLLISATADAKNVEEFNDFTSKKQALNRQIVQIKEITQKIKQNATILEDKKKQIAELEQTNNSRLETLGAELYNACKTFIPPAFVETKDEADTLTESINGYKKKAEDLKLELERATILQKIPVQFKLSSINNSLSVQQKKLCNLLKNGAKKVVSSGKNALADMPTPDSLLASFASCISIAEEIESKNTEIFNINEEIISFRTNLISLSVNDSNGKRRIAQINEEINNLENEQKKLCQKVGQNYVNLYCTIDGEEILQCTGIGENEMPQIIENRKKLKSISRRFEILKLTNEIEEAERKILQFNGEASDIAQKIEILQQKAKTVEEKISAANSAKEILIAKRAMVENEEGITLKLLKEEFGDFQNIIPKAEKIEKQNGTGETISPQGENDTSGNIENAESAEVAENIESEPKPEKKRKKAKK